MLGAVVHTSRGAQMGWGKRVLRGQQKSQDGSCHHMQPQTLWGLQSSHHGCHLGFSNTLSPPPPYGGGFTHPKQNWPPYDCIRLGSRFRMLKMGCFPLPTNTPLRGISAGYLRKHHSPKILFWTLVPSPRSPSKEKKCLNVYFLCVPEPVILLSIYGETWWGGAFLWAEGSELMHWKTVLGKKTGEQLTEWLQQHPVHFAFLSGLRVSVLSCWTVSPSHFSKRRESRCLKIC